MGLVLVTLVLSVAVGYAAGGRLARLDRVPYEGLSLLAVASVVYFIGVAAAIGGLPVRPTYGLALALSGGLVGAFFVRSLNVAGTGLLGLGLLLNALVVVANGGMPVSADAADRAGLSYSDAIAGPLHVAGEGSVLQALGDVVPVPLPWWPEVDSIGDLLVAAGLAQLTVTAMLPARGRRRPTRHRAPAARPALVAAGGGRPDPDEEFVPGLRYEDTAYDRDPVPELVATEPAAGPQATPEPGWERAPDVEPAPLRSSVRGPEPAREPAPESTFEPEQDIEPEPAPVLTRALEPDREPGPEPELDLDLEPEFDLEPEPAPVEQPVRPEPEGYEPDWNTLVEVRAAGRHQLVGERRGTFVVWRAIEVTEPAHADSGRP